MMSSSTDDPLPLSLDTDQHPTDTVILSMAEVEQAVAHSTTVRAGDQWPAYLNALALLGFQQWLSERGIELNLDDPSCSINQPLLAGILKAVGNLSIHGFTLCLIPSGSLTDDRVAIPRATIEWPALVPHLFVGLDIQEEYRQVRVWGCLRHDQLRSRLSELQTNPDWTYSVPRSWFDDNPDSLMLYLTCLEPQAITRVALTPTAASPVESLTTLLSTLAPRLHSSLKPLWKLLTWEQIADSVMQPELQRFLITLISPPTSQGDRPTADSVQPISQCVIQVSQWLHNQLGSIAQAWSWSLLPPISALRGEERLQDTPSPVEQFEQVVTTLGQQGITVPSHARGAYRDLEEQGVAIRLYGITWDLSPSSQRPEWVLLLLLGAQPTYELPSGISLQVRDEHHILDEQTLSQSRPDAYLFSQIIGEWHEQFWISITLADGLTIKLPPFTFSESQE